MRQLLETLISGTETRLTDVRKKARPFMAIILLLLLRECDRSRRVCGDLSRFTTATSPVKDGEKHVMNQTMGSKGKKSWGRMACNTQGSVCMMTCTACETGFILQ